MPYTLYDWFIDDADAKVLVKIGDRQFWIPVTLLDSNLMHGDAWQPRALPPSIPWSSTTNLDVLASVPGVEEVKS